MKIKALILLLLLSTPAMAGNGPHIPQGTFSYEWSTTYYNGHTYIAAGLGYRMGLTHDPDCKAKHK